MEYSRKTKLGRVEWNPGTLAGVLANERHCGDVLARKTFTPNFLTHGVQFVQALLEANGLAAGKDYQFKGRYEAEKNAVIISLEKDEREW